MPRLRRLGHDRGGRPPELVLRIPRDARSRGRRRAPGLDGTARHRSRPSRRAGAFDGGPASGGARHQQGISLRQETASGAAVRRRQQATARPRESHPSRSGWFAESRKPSLRALGSVGSLPDVDQFDQSSVYSCSPGDPVHRRNKARWSAERAAATAPTASSATPLAAAASSWRSILSSASASPRDADHTEGA
jgi:hypothetical protein